MRHPPAPSVDTSTGRSSDRRGVALVFALFGIVILAIVMSGAFFTSTQEFRGTRNALVEQRSFALAEYGLNSEIANWDRARNLPGNFAIGDVDSTKVYPVAGDTAWVKVSRLTDNTFFVVSEGIASTGDAQVQSRRTTSAFVRIAYPTIEPKGAITAAGNVNVTGSATVDGTDTDPSGWAQCSQIPGGDMPGVTIPTDKTASTQGAGSITGNPPIVNDPVAADPDTYVRYGSESWNSLVANADITIPGGTYNSAVAPAGDASTCTFSNFNWGEPFRPGIQGCYDYFPIIYASGSVKLNGPGRGQGILLVNGDLEINGTFEFYGIVVVRDDITKGNGTAEIYGAVFAGNVDLSPQSVWMAGNKDVFYSSCAVQSALKGSAILVRATQRHWAQIF